MTFDMEKARTAYEKIRCKEHIRTDYDVFAVATYLPAALDEIERLQAENDRLRTPNASDDWGNPLVLSVSGTCGDAQAKRIAELQSLNEDLMANGNSLRTRAQKAEARDQLIADGKIGNSDHIVEANKMMLTREQRAAIQRLIEPIEIMLVDHDTDPDIEDAVRKLRSLLSSAAPAWEVTEERKAAILAATKYVISPRDDSILLAMLEEVAK